MSPSTPSSDPHFFPVAELVANAVLLASVLSPAPSQFPLRVRSFPTLVVVVVALPIICPVAHSLAIHTIEPTMLLFLLFLLRLETGVAQLRSGPQQSQSRS